MKWICVDRQVQALVAASVRSTSVKEQSGRWAGILVQACRQGKELAENISGAAAINRALEELDAIEITTASH